MYSEKKKREEKYTYTLRPSTATQQSIIEHNGRNLKSRVTEEWYYLRPLDQIAVDGVLGLVIVEVELHLLVCVVVVLGIQRLPEAEDTDPIADPDSKHHGLEARGVVEHERVVRSRPLLGRPAGLADEAAQGVVLDDAGAEDVEARVSDEERGAVGGVAGDKVQEVGGLADVYEDGDAIAVGVAEAAVTAGAEVEDVAVDEGEAGLGADVAAEALDAGVVEADDEVVAVNEVAVLGIQEDAAVADHGAAGEARPPGRRRRVGRGAA